MTFLEAALEILKRERRPLHFKELTEKATERKLLTFVGRTPEVTMQTQLTAAVKKAPGSPFVRVKPGVFGLLRYPEAPAEPEPEATPEKPRETRTAAGEARSGRRRRRGGRGRRRGRGDTSSEGGAPNGAAGETATEGTSPVEGVEERDGSESPEEPQIGSLSPEARAAALAESGVLEGDGDDRDAEEPGKQGLSATTAMRAWPATTRVPRATKRQNRRRRSGRAEAKPSPAAGAANRQNGAAQRSPASRPAPVKGQGKRPRRQARARPGRPPSRGARSARPSMQPSRS